MTIPPAAPTTNTYQIGSLIFAHTTPTYVPLSWRLDGKDPIVCVAYPTSIRWFTKTVKWSAQSTLTMRNPRSSPPPICQNQYHLWRNHTHTPGISPSGFHPKTAKPRAPPANRGVAARPPSAAPAVPAVPAAPANQNAEPAPPRRRSPRLNPRLGHAHTIKSQPPARQPHSAPTNRTANRPEMVHTYPLTINYNGSIGSKENPLSFASLRLVDLRNGHSQYPSTLKQLRDALPKTLDPASRFALRGHVARPGQLRPCHFMRAALWFLLPSDGEFRCSSTSLQYYLACQGWRVILRGGDVTRPPLESYFNWVEDPAPSLQGKPTRKISIPQQNPVGFPVK